MNFWYKLTLGASFTSSTASKEYSRSLIINGEDTWKLDGSVNFTLSFKESYGDIYFISA